MSPIYIRNLYLSQGRISILIVCSIAIIVLTTIQPLFAEIPYVKECNGDCDTTYKKECYGHFFNPGSWGMGWPKKCICVSDYGKKARITVTVDQCSIRNGDAGEAGSYIGNPGRCVVCDPDPPLIGCDNPCACCEDNDLSYEGFGTYKIIIIRGNQDNFDDFFPNGITFTYGTNLDVTVKKVNYEYLVPGTKVKIKCQPSNRNLRSTGASFGYTIRYYDLGAGLEVSNDFWLYQGTEGGSIQVRINPRTNFDPFNFNPDIGYSGGSAWIDKIERQYTGPSDPNEIDPNDQTEWSWEYENCVDDIPHECECEETIHWYLGMGLSTTYFRAKFPAWSRDVCLGSTQDTPLYMAGWGAVYNTGNNKYLSLSLGNLGTMYYNCDHQSVSSENKYLITTIEHCPQGVSRGSSSGTTLWTFTYETGTDKVTSICNTNSSIRYQYSH